MSFIKRFIVSFLTKRKENKFRHNAICGESAKFDFTSGCSNSTGSKENIVIGNDCWIRGSVFAVGKGNVHIGDRTYIGGAVRIGALQEIKIGNDVIIGNDTHIYDNNNHPVDYNKRLEITAAKDYASPLWGWNDDVARKPIEICDNVWIGERVTILKGVTVGRGSVVACNAVVTKDVPEFSVVAGNPATVVKQL